MMAPSSALIAANAVSCASVSSRPARQRLREEAGPLVDDLGDDRPEVGVAVALLGSGADGASGGEVAFE